MKIRKIIEYGIEALKAIWHRGAVDADGKSGDGAGILIQIPNEFFSSELQKNKITKVVILEFEKVFYTPRLTCRYYIIIRTFLLQD